MKSPIRVLLVDDQPTVRQGLRMRLALEPDVDVVGEAADGAAALAAMVSATPDVVLMDVEMPVMDGITAAGCIHAATPDTAIIMLSLHDDLYTRERARASGAVDFVAKHQIDGALTEAIRAAASRRTNPRNGPRSSG